MKTIKIKNATRPFGIFLMAMDVRFAYSYGEFFVFGIKDIDKFKNFCIQHGVRPEEIESMFFEVADFDLD